MPSELALPTRPLTKLTAPLWLTTSVPPAPLTSPSIPSGELAPLLAPTDRLTALPAYTPPDAKPALTTSLFPPPL